MELFYCCLPCNSVATVSVENALGLTPVSWGPEAELAEAREERVHPEDEERRAFLTEDATPAAATATLGGFVARGLLTGAGDRGRELLLSSRPPLAWEPPAVAEQPGSPPPAAPCPRRQPEEAPEELLERQCSEFLVLDTAAEPLVELAQDELPPSPQPPAPGSAGVGALPLPPPALSSGPGKLLLALSEAAAAAGACHAGNEEDGRGLEPRLQGPEEFALGLVKKGRPLGLSLSYSREDDFLMISGIAPGAVQDLNLGWEESPVRVFDAIVEVNGFRGSALDMVERINAEDMLQLVLARYHSRAEVEKVLLQTYSPQMGGA